MKRTAENHLMHTAHRCTLYNCILFIGIMAFTVYSRFEDITFCSPYSYGSILSVSEYNPSLLPITEPPYMGLVLPSSVHANFSNNKFFIFDPRYLFDKNNNTIQWVSYLLQKSFDLSNQSPKKSSEILSEELKNGIFVTSNLFIPIFNFSQNKPDSLGWGAKIKFNIRGLTHVPGSVFLSVFSYTHGIQPGNTLQFDDLSSYYEATTDFHVSLGTSFPRGRPTKKKSKMHLSWGVDMIYRMGHAFVQLETKHGEISFSKNNILSVKGHSVITTSDTGICENYQLNNPFKNGIAINGNGFGISGGLTLYNNRSSLSINVLKLGTMIWHTGVMQADFIIEDDSLFLFDFFQGKKYQKYRTSFSKKERHIQSFETNLACEYSYRWNNLKLQKKSQGSFSKYLITYFGYNQPLITRVSQKKTPDFSIAFENGFFKGMLPLQIGWTFGSYDLYTSFIQLKIIANASTFSLVYRSISDYLFRWNRGIEIGLKTHYFWNLGSKHN